MFRVVLVLLQTVSWAQQARKGSWTLSQSTSQDSQLPVRRIAKPPASSDIATSILTR